MNQWTIPVLALAGGYVFYVYKHQDPDKKTPDATNPSERPDVRSFAKTGNRLWQRIEKVRAKGLYPVQPSRQGYSSSWFVQLLDGSLIKVYGSREKVMQKLILEPPK